MIKKVISSIYRKYFLSAENYAKSIGVKVGQNCLISTKNFSSEPYLIEIGDFCRIASGVSFFTHGGLWSQRKRTGLDLDTFGKIKIGNYTYIGQDAKILPGVSVGDNCIIGAGSVVTKSIPDNSIVGGNPARIVGDVHDFIERAAKMDVGTKKMSYSEKKAFLLSLSNDKFLQK